MTYNPDSYWSAYEDTAATLGSVQGLVLALYEIGSEHDGLNNPDPTSNAILSLMRVIEEKVEQAVKQHEKELVRFRMQKEQSCVSEGGK